MSLGGDGPCNLAERDAIAEIVAHGAVVVAAAGRLVFADANNGSFAYSVSGVAQT